jgi:hypothetical protein
MRRELIAVVMSIVLVMDLWGCVALGSTTPSVGDVLTSAGKTCVFSVTNNDGFGYVEVPCRESRPSEWGVSQRVRIPTD